MIVGENERLTARKRRFIAALLATPTVRGAAEEAGISETSAWRYLSDPAVKGELAQRQDGILGHVARRLASEMGEALDVLHGVMTDATANDAPRVSAARAVLESGLRLAELVTLAERVATLEERLGKDGQS